MAEPTMNSRCTHCGALLKSAGKRTLVTCEFCGTEQSLRPEVPDDEEPDEDAPDSEPWEEDAGDDEQSAPDDDDDGPLANEECIELLRQHIEDASDEYEGEPLLIELDEENTDDERVYLYVKGEDGEVLDYFLVDRSDGMLEVYDYETEVWNEA
jgi:predicted  nucleic acid-binding Zn-ribbon protein